MSTTIDFKLPENLTISNVATLQEQLELLVDEKDCDSIRLLGEDVQRADTAGLQLLLAFVRASQVRKIKVDWGEPSEKLSSVAQILGLDGLLGLQQH